MGIRFSRDFVTPQPFLLRDETLNGVYDNAGDTQKRKRAIRQPGRTIEWDADFGGNASSATKSSLMNFNRNFGGNCARFEKRFFLRKVKIYGFSSWLVFSSSPFFYKFMNNICTR